MDKEDVVQIYITGYYLAIKKNEIMLSVGTWTDPKISILSDVNQTEKGKYLILLICKISRKRYQ